MDDKIKISLQMGGATFPLTIRREDEEIVRNAAKQVDTRLNTYRERYKGERIITLVAYQFALESLQHQQRNNTAPYTQKIAELTELLENYFKED